MLHTVLNQAKPLIITMAAGGIALTSDSRGYERHFHVTGTILFLDFWVLVIL